MSRVRRKLDPEFPLHITGRCNNRERFPIPMDEAWEMFSDNLHVIRGEFRIKILAFVLMPNHYHLIARDPEMRASRAMEYFHRETSKDMGRQSGRINRLWGAPFHSTVIANPLYYLHAYKYLYRNPVAARLCGSVEEYPWSTLQILLGGRRGSIPMELDETLFNDVEKSLEWLNTPYSASEAEKLKSGFRRKIFKIPKDPTTRKKDPLEFPSSLGYAVNPGMLGGTLWGGSLACLLGESRATVG